MDAADTTSGTSTGGSSTSGSESTGTTTTGEEEESDVGPCLTTDSCLSVCACDTSGDVDGNAVALAMLPLLIARSRTRREILERFRTEARLPADVLARLRESDDPDEPR